MKRTLSWAVVAFYPLIVLAAATQLGERVDAYFARQVAVSSLGALVANYWWSAVVVTVICVIALFLASVLRNRILPAWGRMLWAAAMVLFGPIAAPAYWWKYSGHGVRGTPQ
jgi:hypothetical protein